MICIHYIHRRLSLCGISTNLKDPPNHAMQIMTPPPTPGRAGDEKSRQPMKTETQRHRTEKERLKSIKKHKRRAEKNKQQHERGSVDGPAAERGNEDSITETFSDVLGHNQRARLELHGAERPEQALPITRKRKNFSKIEQAEPRHTKSKPATPRREMHSSFHNRHSARARNSEDKHMHTKKRHRSSQGTPIPTAPFTFHSLPSSLTSNSKHERRHTKMRCRISHDESTSSPSSNVHRSQSVPRTASFNTNESDSEAYLEQELDMLLQTHLFLPSSPLNPLEHLLSLPTYSPVPSNPILSSAYTLLGSMEAEQHKLYHRSSDIEARIKKIRSTPWNLDNEQEREVERLKRAKEACEGLAMELMLEEGAFRDLFERGWQGQRWHLGTEVNGMRARVGGLMKDFEERMNKSKEGD